MTIFCSWEVDRSAQIKVLDDALGGHIKSVSDAFRDDFKVFGFRAERFDVDADRLSDTDCIGKADDHSISESSGNYAFGDMASHVSGRSVDFGGVFAGESSAAVWAHAAVSIDNDLPPGEACVAIWATRDEPSGWVDVVGDFVGCVLGEFVKDRRDDFALDNVVDFVFDFRAVLLAKNDSINFQRLIIFVDH